MTNEKRSRVLLILFLIIVFVCLSLSVFQLSQYVPLHDWDEAIYAQVAREWSHNPSITLFYNGVAWFEKPPIPFVIMGALMWIFGDTTLPIRLISTVLGTLSVLFVFLISEKITKKPLIGFLASSIYICSYFFIDRSTIVNVDIYLTLAWLLYVYSEKQMFRIASIILGVGSKSLLGFVPLCVDFAFSVMSKTLTVRRMRDYGVQLILGLVWHVAMTVRYGSIFVQSHFFDHLISRVAKPIELHFGDKFFYVSRIWGDLTIFSVLAVVGVIMVSFHTIKTWRQNVREDEGYLRLIGTSFSVPIGYLLLLTLSKAKLHWYVMPLIPFVAVGAALAISVIRNKIPHKVFHLLVTVFVVGSLWGFGARTITTNFETYVLPEKTELALCMKQSMIPNATVAYIVSPQERSDAHVIEAAQLQIGSSFIYGSAPAFRYYVDAPVRYIYDPSQLDNELFKSAYVVLSSEDMTHRDISSALYRRRNANSLPTPICQTDTKLAFRLP